MNKYNVEVRRRRIKDYYNNTFDDRLLLLLNIFEILPVNDNCFVNLKEVS